MIFFCNAQGTITSVVSSPVYQGSNYANEVVFVAPFASASVVTVSFILPNGAYTTAGLMTLTPISNVVDDNNVAYNAWTYLVPSAFTEYSGTMTAQFAITNGTTVNKTASSSFTVEKGVPTITTDPPEDIYQQILTALSSVNTQINNLEQSVDGLEENKLDKQSGSSTNTQVYGVKNGNQIMLNVSDGSTMPFSAIPQYQLSGELWVQRPTNSNNAANKGYVDDVAKNKLDKQSGVASYPQVYGVQNNVQQLYALSDGNTVPPFGAIAQYTENGNLFSQPPVQGSDVTNKEYVDTADENLSNEIETLRQDIDSKSHFRGYLTTTEIQSLPNPDNGDYAWSSDTLTVWSYNGSQWVNTGNPVPDQTVPKGETTPLPDAANGSAGSTTSYAAIDHVHPKSDIYASAEEFNELNTDYQAFKTNQTTINSSVNNTLLQLASDIVTSETQTGAFINGQNTLKDVTASVEVQSENLIPFPYDDLNGRVENGITYTINSDGSLTLNGTATGNSSFTFSYTKQFLSPGTYTFSCVNSTSEIRCTIRKNNSSWIDIIGTPQVANFEKNDVLNQVNIFVFQGAVCNNLTLYPKIQAGTVATPYTPYLPAGSPVNITACGKNLFDSSQNKVNGSADVSIPSQNAITVTSIETGTYNGAGINILAKTLSGKTLTLSGSWSVSAQNTGGLRLCWVNSEGVVLSTDLFLSTSGSSVSGILSNPPENTTYLVLFIYVNVSGTLNVGDTVTYTNVQLEIGDNATAFEPYQGQDYSSQVGQTVDVEQYDGITNIFTTTEGGAVSTQFFLSTEYELNDKVNLLVGTLANRPTTTQAYGVIYIATDQTGATRVTYLPPNTDGSTSENWIAFNS